MTKRLKGLYRMLGSQYWWFRYSRDGQRFAISLKTPDEALAITRARAILAEGLIAAEQYSPSELPPRRREIHGLVDKYLADAQGRNRKPLRAVTAETRRYILKKFCSDMGIERVGDITAQKINQWLKKLKEDGKSQDTRWTYGERLRNFVKFLTPKYLSSSILDGFELPEPSPVGRKNWVRKEEVAKLIDAAETPELKFILFCGFDSGLRRNEISEMRVSWFDLSAGLLHVTNDANFTSKDRDNRVIPMTERFLAFAKSFLAGRNPSEYVLMPTKTAKGKAKYRFDCSKRVRTHFVNCKAKCTFHDMRRSFASNRVSDGVSIYKVATWLGDGLEVTAKSYGKLAPNDPDVDYGIKDVAEKVSGELDKSLVEWRDIVDVRPA
jgi:integrase